MVMSVKVTVILAENVDDWGSPPATSLAIIWSNAKVYENGFPQSGVADADNRKNIAVTVSDKGKTKDHTFVKENAGYINVYMFQGNVCHRIGEANYGPPVKVVGSNDKSLIWEPRGSVVSIETTHLGDSHVKVNAFGGIPPWGGFNECKTGILENTKTATQKTTNVNSVMDCLGSDVVAFDYDAINKECTQYHTGTKFGKQVTAVGARSPQPNTSCYMTKSTWNTTSGKSNKFYVTKHNDWGKIDGSSFVSEAAAREEYTKIANKKTQAVGLWNDDLVELQYHGSKEICSKGACPQELRDPPWNGTKTRAHDMKEWVTKEWVKTQQ
jgi:hypothetical protein